MKTTEELRKELDYWVGRRDEFKGGLNLTNEIRIAENLLKASEKGDLLFGDKQVQSKLAYVNDLLATSGIPLMVARKSDFLDYTHPREAEESYKGLALMYHRKDNKGFQLLDSFDTVETVGEILDQLTIVEQQKDLLYFLCSLTKTKGRPPYYRGQLGKGNLIFTTLVKKVVWLMVQPCLSFTILKLTDTLLVLSAQLKVVVKVVLTYLHLVVSTQKLRFIYLM